MKNEVIEVFKKVLHKFKNDSDTEYICFAIDDVCEDNPILKKHSHSWLNDNKPSKVLFSEIYTHELFYDGHSWWYMPNDDCTESIKQKIKYLELLIAKLESE